VIIKYLDYTTNLYTLAVPPRTPMKTPIRIVNTIPTKDIVKTIPAIEVLLPISVCKSTVVL